MIQQVLSRRKVAAAVRPLDKAHAKEFFEFLHLGAEGRLGDIGCLGRSRKVSVLTVNDKVPQLLYRWQFHVTPPLKRDSASGHLAGARVPVSSLLP